jgi:hypothetical protein
MIYGYTQESSTTWVKSHNNYYGVVIINDYISGSVTWRFDGVESTNRYMDKNYTLIDILKHIDKFMNIK